MTECLLLQGCPWVFDAACPLMRGPCPVPMPEWWEPTTLLLWTLLWSIAVVWWVGLGRRERRE